ncbi:AraC family transcriptional regulator [Lachnospiraceae bacterium 46-15]
MKRWIELNKDKSENIPYGHAEYPFYILHTFLSEYPNYAASPHWHDDIELLVILNGRMSYNINGKIEDLETGQGIFVNSRQMHFGFSEEHNECEFICVLVHPLVLCLTPELERNYAAPVLHNNNIPYIKLANSGWHKDIIQGTQEIYRLRDTATAPLKIQGIFSWIWASVYENMPGADSEEQPCSSDLSILKNMTGFIQKHYHEKISLSQIAAAGGIGQSKCCKLFSSYFHQTPNTYLTVYRLNRSAELLRTTDRSITEVAYAAGFNGASYYAETFRKWFHVSPSEYRSNLER